MSRRTLAQGLLVAASVVALVPSLGAGAPKTAFLFTYFTRNGEDGLHLAWSRDGYRWESLNDGRSYLTPTVGKAKLMRDPCPVRGPDGTYHMVWTSGWWENNIGYASTRDFITWSAQKEFPVMAHEPTVRNSWAPEIVWEEKQGRYLIFWSSTIPGRFSGAPEGELNHRIYATTTKDFVTLAPTRLFYQPDFNVIDATIFRADQRFGLVVKDETKFPAPRKNLRLALGDDPEGPWGELSPPFTPAGIWAEGPSVVRIGDSFLLYFDAYGPKHYGAMRSRDLVHWEDVTKQMSFPYEGTPARMRHGTVIEVPMALVDRLQTQRVDVTAPVPAGPAK